MAPIYNPPASGGTSISNDEQYFTDLGLISGLSKIIDITGGNTFPTPDETYGVAAVITNNMLKWGTTYNTDSWVGWNIGTMSTVLMICYTTPSLSYVQHMIVCKELADSAKAYIGDDIYMSANSPASNPDVSQMWKEVGGVYTVMGSDATICREAGPLVSSSTYGSAIYVTDSVQKYWVKYGSTGNWMPIFSETDANITSFKSVGLWSRASDQRCTTPFTVWGA